MAAGFPKNNHKETVGDMFADNVSWDWSDGTKGEGHKDQLFDIFSKTWGFMVSSFVPTNPFYVVDTENGIITITTPLVINIDGGLPEAHLVSNGLCFVLKFVEGKITRWVYTFFYFLSILIPLYFDYFDAQPVGRLLG